MTYNSSQNALYMPGVMSTGPVSHAMTGFFLLSLFVTDPLYINNVISCFLCVAICNQGCHNGSCTSPGVCSCNSGWTGNTCNTGKGDCY